MRTFKLLLAAICMAFLLQSCEKEATIRVQNNISQVTITDVEWDNRYISWTLFPGETSQEKTISGSDLPIRSKISFKMQANNKTIYLETEEEFLLDEDDKLLIVLDDNTKVSNPKK